MENRMHNKVFILKYFNAFCGAEKPAELGNRRLHRSSFDMKKIVLGILCAHLACFAVAQTQQAPKVTVDQSAYFALSSAIMGQEYYIKVYLPESYGQSDKKYPVLYLLDGDHAFGMATDIVTYLIYGKHIPEIIIVSPSYGSKNGPNEGGTNMRNRDFAAIIWSNIKADSAAYRYFDFLTRELIPLVEQTYRVNPDDRTLWGYSMSGLLAMWAVFERPGFFNRYVIIDTAFRLFKQIEETYHKSHTELPASLYLGIGNPDRRPDDVQFLENLKQRGYKGLQFEYEALQGGKHFLVPSTGLALGLSSVYNN
ncbi:MAG: hypothetical protein KIPDCIKN_02641 [Haliscomenobacter sp.]|nr:hypothetical protein [Haliscomenobacter sp.]